MRPCEASMTTVIGFASGIIAAVELFFNVKANVVNASSGSARKRAAIGRWSLLALLIIIILLLIGDWKKELAIVLLCCGNTVVRIMAAKLSPAPCPAACWSAINS